MKAAIALLFLLVFGPGNQAVCAQGTPGRLEAAEFSGKRYLALGNWARANNFEARWLKRDEIVQLSNHAARMVFTKDSPETVLNGVNVRLCYPIVFANSTAYISEVDVQSVIQPVLSPPKNLSGLKVKNIVIDPGHGGKDPGFQDGSHQEKKYTLLLAQELCDQLKRAGFKASLTRTTDSSLEKTLRPDIARHRAADLFISLHWNSAGSPRSDVKGLETYCLTPTGAPSTNARGDTSGAETRIGNRNNAKNMLLAYVLQRSLVKNLGVEDRGVHRARFAVLCPAEMPAVLIEGGFMSHPTESKRIYDPAYRRQMARAIVEGIFAYKNAVELGKQ